MVDVVVRYDADAGNVVGPGSSDGDTRGAQNVLYIPQPPLLSTSTLVSHLPR